MFSTSGKLHRTGDFRFNQLFGGGFTLYNLTGTGKSIGIGNIGADQDAGIAS
jgi:hypothetical protein